MDIFIQQLVNGVVLGSIYALVALGYTMVYGILGLINFAHGDLVMVGALSALALLKVCLAVGLGLPASLALATLGAVLLCGGLGVLIERVAYRPLRSAPKLAPLITAIGVSILIEYGAAMIWSKQYLALPPVIQSTTWQLAGAAITDLQVAIVVMASVLMAGLLWLIRATPLGVAMRATEQNAEVAGLMGIDTHRVIAITFLIGSGLAALAGIMVLLYYGVAHYFMGFMLGLKAFTAAVLGGIGSVPGAMLGGLLLGLIESLGAGYVGELTGGVFGSNYRDVFAFIVLILVLVLRPAGLLGTASGERA